MKIKYFLAVVIISLSYSCVTKSSYDQLEQRLDSLQLVNDNLIRERNQLKENLFFTNKNYDELLNEKRKLEAAKNSKPYITESQALDYVKDHYEFYNADKIFRKANVRRIDRNTFNISLEECSKRGSFKEDDYFWDAIVKKLVVNTDGTYSLTRVIASY